MNAPATGNVHIESNEIRISVSFCNREKSEVRVQETESAVLIEAPKPRAALTPRRGEGRAGRLVLSSVQRPIGSRHTGSDVGTLRMDRSASRQRSSNCPARGSGVGSSTSPVLGESIER